MLRQLKKGQSTAEYAIVIGLVIAAAVGMQVYVKRGIQGKVRDASDAKIVVDGSGPDYGVNSYGQYEPGYNGGTSLTTLNDSTETATRNQNGGVKREIQGVDTSSRTGTQVIQGVPKN